MLLNYLTKKKLICTTSFGLNQAIEKFKADRNSNLLLAALISSAQNTSDFSKSIIEEEQQSLGDYDSKAMSALVFKKLNILSASVTILDNVLKKFSKKDDFTDEFDYLDKLQQECSIMAQSLKSLANGCGQVVNNKHSQVYSLHFILFKYS